MIKVNLLKRWLKEEKKSKVIVSQYPIFPIKELHCINGGIHKYFTLWTKLENIIINTIEIKYMYTCFFINHILFQSKSINSHLCMQFFISIPTCKVWHSYRVERSWKYIKRIPLEWKFQNRGNGIYHHPVKPINQGQTSSMPITATISTQALTLTCCNLTSQHPITRRFTANE